MKGKKTVAALLEGTPNVIAYVAGHTHANRDPTSSAAATATASGRSTPRPTSTGPSRARLVEIMDNHDGTLSLFGTMLDSAAPAAAPAPGSASAFTTTQLASLARTLAFNDPQDSGLEGSAGGGSKAGTRKDRNVELVVRDPR